MRDASSSVAWRLGSPCGWYERVSRWIGRTSWTKMSSGWMVHQATGNRRHPTRLPKVSRICSRPADGWGGIEYWLTWGHAGGSRDDRSEGMGMGDRIRASRHLSSRQGDTDAVSGQIDPNQRG